MGRSVDDIVRLLTVLARLDERDALGLPADGVRYHERLDLASQLINQLRHRGILIGAAGPYGNTLKIRPPLCFTEENADMFTAAGDEVLREICPA
jgi:4-aminobutyrate aminotransferase-like enzyme